MKLTIKNLSTLQVSMPAQSRANVRMEIEKNLRPVALSSTEWMRLAMVSAKSSWMSGLSDIHMQ